MTQRLPKFQESQRFSQPWIWVVVVLPLLVVLVVFSYGLYQQLVLGRPFGNNPASDTGLIIGAVFGILIPLLVVAGLLVVRLVTTVTGPGLLIEFRPLRHKRLIEWQQILSCQARDYRPIREYGGWGMRSSPKAGRAYNVSGSRGVQLQLADGEQLLIGSQQANKLARAIKAHIDAVVGD